MGEPWPIGGAATLAPVPNGNPAGALQLYAKLLGASSVEAGAHALVAALAEQYGFGRVSFGLHERGRTRLIASSMLDLRHDAAELPQRLVGAMDEAIEQGLALAWPESTDGATVDGIRLEQQALQRRVGGCVMTLPLGLEGEVVGALCIESQAPAPLSADARERLEATLALALPALRWMQIGAMPWHRRVRRDLVEAWAALRQPQRRGRRRLLAAVAVAFAFLALAPLEHQVGGRARIEGAQQRVLAAPTDGFVKTAHVRPGDRVRAGAPLVDLLEQDLRLERERWSSQLAQHENAYASAMARSDRVAAATSMERVAEAQAQLGLLDEQLVRGRITAPFDALVVQGDLSQSIGAPVRQGDPLLTLATTDRYRIIVEVDEIDIARVQPGQTGRLSLSSLPWQHEALIVERIVPLAKAVDGRNVFEVEASLVAPREALRPGLLGRADVVIGRRPPLWAWAGQTVDRLRLAVWAWIG